MDSGDHLPDPFSSESLWRLSKFSIEALQPLEALPWDADLSGILDSGFKNASCETGNIESVWKLDSLSSNLESTPSLTDSVADPLPELQSDAPTDDRQDNDEVDDIWKLDSLQEETPYIAPLKTWERYQDRSFCEPVSAYFSESGAGGFDAVLRRKANSKGQQIEEKLVRNDIFIRSLLRLGLGWSSALFRYNKETKTFEKSMDSIRVSGMTSSVLDTVITDVLQCGTQMQQVRTFVQNAPTKPKDLPSLSTLRGTVAVIIYNLEQQIISYSSQVVSVLQIMTLFRRCGDLIGALSDIVHASETASSDARIISIVMERAMFFAHRFGWMENLVQEIVIRILGPWLGFVECWIGLRPKEDSLNELLARGRTFVQLEHHNDNTKFKTGSARSEYYYQAEHMPSFIPRDQAQTIFESGRSLRLLKKSHPHHPIARHDVLARAGPLHLHCATTWNDIERIQGRVNEYESNLRHEILKYYSGQSDVQTIAFEPAFRSDDHPDDDQVLEKTFELFDIDEGENASSSVIGQKALSNDKVGQFLQEARDPSYSSEDAGAQFGPDLTSGIYLSLAPIIFSQAQLIDFSCLHHLFKEHRVRHHLNLQWRFQLLGDGSFASHLSHSLFDPEMASGERKSGVVRSGVHTGLRLGNRDTWPPASSELRLVLIGLLGDCYFSEDDTDATETPQNRGKELPGGLSFAIRELTDEEIERCRDPNAIEALDFLRLQYKPPEALEPLITTRSLKRYDRLFKHLLRLLRMVSVVKGIVRDSTARGSLSGDTHNVFQRFRIEAQHFVLAISDYCFQIGIGSTWNHFQKTLSRIEHCLDHGDIDGTIEAAHSVPRLRDFHEDVLDQMLFAFFLSKRHAQAAKLLDSIFSTILAFSPLSKADGLNGLRHESEGTVLHLYSTFRKQMSAFLGYLRSLDSGKGSAKSMAKSEAFFSSRIDPTSVFEHIRLRLDVKEYY
ncbi:hypothetical protein N7462_005607 [Penicillium macrosclerotiorum]|uniref:uncharacterized protein n=1 Tax=Penicillium macrosclerotiorum TaxID=303699 RepID=UPI0025495215|nr:uncharacterized protein N7462_005607 [Penicillium macrosclerotiorum]KAJ5682442.1 hypothetical protein N7462_005607 [Penicillium macrosclerotiorum]